MTTSLSPGHRSTKQHIKEQRGALHPVPANNHWPPLHLVKPEGQLQVHTAPYRGSFSVVLSEALRAAGLGRRVMVSQFLKGGVSQGAQGAIHLCGRLEWLRPSISCCLVGNDKQDFFSENKSNAIKAVKEIWEICKDHILAGDLDQLVLDEVGLAIEFGYLKENELINTLEQRPGEMDVILTGPSIPNRVICMADQVTELRSGH